MTRAELARSIVEREMTPQEFDEKVREALADETDMRSVSELIAWFTRRYPTIEERLRYVSRRMKTEIPQLLVERRENDER